MELFAVSTLVEYPDADESILSTEAAFLHYEEAEEYIQKEIERAKEEYKNENEDVSSFTEGDTYLDVRPQNHHYRWEISTIHVPLPKDDLEEACRRWCRYIDQAPERRYGAGFASVVEEVIAEREGMEG